MVDYSQLFHAIDFDFAFTKLGNGFEPTILPWTHGFQIHHRVLRPIERIRKKRVDLFGSCSNIDGLYGGTRYFLHRICSLFNEPLPRSLIYLEPGKCWIDSSPSRA